MAQTAGEEISAALERKIGRENRKKLEKAAVAVCGLGGVGSNVAAMLAGAGVGKLILADFDTVCVSNLSRQRYKFSQTGRLKTEALAENITEFSPCTELELYSERLDESNYMKVLAGAEIICEAFDDAEEKSRLVNFALEKMPDKIVISASGMAGLGSPNEIKTRRLAENFFLCGDEKSAEGEDLPIYSARAALCAAHQALTALRIILGEI